MELAGTVIPPCQLLWKILKPHTRQLRRTTYSSASKAQNLQQT